MKKLVLIHIFTAYLLACSGDCLSCHPTLNIQSDVRHKSLSTCITCHTAESLSQTNMGAACGQDCFACHDAGKLTGLGVREHDVITNCIACHTTLKKDSSANWQEQLGIGKQPPFQLPEMPLIR
ncbi:MAG: hypothetical protein ACTTJS_00925 [Wolinella sp.]